MTLLLDAGALIGFERSDRRVSVLLRRAKRRGDRVVLPSTVLAQVWRGGRRQARVAHMVRRDVAEIMPLGAHEARAVGRLLAATGTSDIVDASVAWFATRLDATVLTSDADDLRRLGPNLKLEPL